MNILKGKELLNFSPKRKGYIFKALKWYEKKKGLDPACKCRWRSSKNKKKDTVRIFKLMIEIIFSVRTSDTSKCK